MNVRDQDMLHDAFSTNIKRKKFSRDDVKLIISTLVADQDMRLQVFAKNTEDRLAASTQKFIDAQTEEEVLEVILVSILGEERARAVIKERNTQTRLNVPQQGQTKAVYLDIKAIPGAFNKFIYVTN